MPANDAIATSDEARRFWIVLFLIGVLLALAGFAALIAPNVVTDLAVFIWGWFLILRGVLELVGSFFYRRQESFLLHLLTGILSLVVGVLVIAYEGTAERVITLLLAAFFLFGGLSQIVAALLVRPDGWLLMLAAGVLGVLIGVAIWRNYPGNSSVILGLFIGIDLLSRGATWIGYGLALKNAPRRA